MVPSVLRAVTAACLVVALVTAHSHQRRGHQCVHDRIVNALGRQAEATNHEHPFHLQSNHAPEGPNVLDGLSGRRLQSSYQPIRIDVKLDLLLDGQDDPYTCEGTPSNPGTFVEGSGQAASGPPVQTTACSADDIMFEGDEKYTFLVDQILRDAVEFFENSLSVLPMSGLMPLTNTWSDAFCFDGPTQLPFVCCDSILPGYVKSPGVSGADYVLFITKRPTLGSTLAWALPCQYDSRTNAFGRPVLGQANFSPARISTDPDDYAEQLSTAIHEIAHALGFTNQRFSQFINPVTGEKLGASSVMLTASDALLQKTTTKIITPNVIDKLKEHFDCYNWPDAGGELEDFGGSGTAGSHWEKRTMFNEFMTGTSDPNSVYSAISLALFEDSGWYQVDYSRAERLEWGFAQGCDFVRQRCGDSWSDRFLCRTSVQEGCTADYRFRAVCNIQSSSVSLPPAYQYFDNPTVGGASPYVDYCPYYTRVSSGDCQSASTRGLWHNGEKPSPGGPNTRCFSGTFVYSGVTTPTEHGACLDWSCHPTTTLLQVQLQTLTAGVAYTVTCPLDGGLVDVSGPTEGTFEGQLRCPPKDLFCTGDPCDAVSCSGHGTCDAGVCACDSGYLGTFCTERRCPLRNGTTTDECSASLSRGTCDRSSGLCSCANGFSGAACEVVGCPKSAGVTCSSPQGTCNTGTGVCQCEPGFVGNACQLTDCPGSPRCGEPDHGTCDSNNGLCTCADNVVAPGAEDPVFYTGADCSTANAGASRPFATLAFAGETDAPDSVVVPLVEKEYAYLNFSVPTVEFPITLNVSVPTAADLSRVAVVAAYQSVGVLPSLAHHQFSVTATEGNAHIITFEQATSGDETNTLNPFDQTGTMLVAVVSTDGDVAVRVQLSRDGCAVLDCLNGATCEAGACQCTEDRIFLIDPPRSYRFGWAGALCDLPDCPGTPDCSNRGTCVVRDATPTCDCNPFYSGVACESTSVNNTQAVVALDQHSSNYDVAQSFGTGLAVVGSAAFVNPTPSAAGSLVDGVSGLVAVNDAFTIAMPLNVSMALVVRLVVHNPDASDAMLFTRVNQAPTVSAYDHFDVQSWTSRSGVHTVATTVPTSTVFVSVRNSRYATAPLNASLYFEAAEVCPPSMTFTSRTGIQSSHLMPGVPAVACSGHGDPQAFCSNPDATTLPPNPVLCACQLGWEGAFCDVPVPALDGNQTLATGVLAPGVWKYYVYPAPASVLDLTVTLTRTSASTRSQPLLMVGRTAARTAASLASVQNSALFDYDAYTRRLPRQTVRVSRSHTLSNRPAQEFFYIGVHNTANARSDFAGTLAVEAATQFQAVCPLVGGLPDAACLNASSYDVCHGRGQAVLGGEQTPAGAVDCQCNTGWNRRTFCGSPKVFDSFSALLGATQDIEFLCNVCQFSQELQPSAVKFFTVPQPLQKATGLTLRTVNDTSATAPLANPSLMVAPYLPRSIADFTSVSSSSAALEQVDLNDPSPTGSYWVALYANSRGHVTLQAERQQLDGSGSDDKQFIVELFSWLTSTSAGNVVFVISLAFLLCVCLGCFCQHVECHGCRPKRRKNPDGLGVFGSSRNLFDPKTPELAAAHSFRHHHSGQPRPGGGYAPPSAKQTPADPIRHAHEVELARLNTRESAKYANPMHAAGSPQLPPSAPAAAATAPPTTYGLYATPTSPHGAQPAVYAPPQAMPDGSAMPPPPPMDSAPRALQMRLRAMRAGSMVGGQGASAILGPRTAVPPPPSI